MSGKGEIEEKLEKFVRESFEKFNLDINTDQMNRENTKSLIKGLMEKYKNDDAWDEKEFDKMFDLFEEDGEEDNGEQKEEGGLDKNEFTKLVKRMAQL